jgi:hypothetical protein
MCLYQSVSLWPLSQSVPLSSSHLLLTFPPSSLSLHNTSSSVPPLAQGTQHFLKPFIVTSGKKCCYAVMIHWQRTVILGLLILPCRVKAWSSVSSHSLYGCFRWSLNSLFTTKSSTCSCEVITPSFDHKVSKCGICNLQSQWWLATRYHLLIPPIWQLHASFHNPMH